MRIVAAGATGFVGSALCAALTAHGHTTQVLTRGAGDATPAGPGGTALVHWSPPRVDPSWATLLADADAVVNLAGASIASGRWTAARKATLRASRLESTGALVDALTALPAERRPRVLVNASAVGYYGDRGDEILTESSRPGDDFLAHLCVEWEAAAARARELGLRVVVLRFGLVFGRSGGALPRLALPFRLFAGGPLGSGRQWVAWIHLDDAAALIVRAMSDNQLDGALNAVAPEPVRQADLARTLGQVLGRPSWLPAPIPALRLALGEMADALLLSSQRARPEVAVAAGFHFQHPDLAAALRASL